jgi:hypothetical protein
VFLLSDEQQNIVSSMLKYIHNKLKDHRIPEDTLSHRKYLIPFENIKTYSQMLTNYIYQLILPLADDGSISKVSSSPDALIFSNAINYMNSQICAHHQFLCNRSGGEAARGRGYHLLAVSNTANPLNIYHNINIHITPYILQF